MKNRVPPIALASFSMVLLLAAPAQAQDQGVNLAPLPPPIVCPALMTDRECVQHVQNMVSLPANELRAVYLSGIDAMLRERAILCGGGQFLRMRLSGLPPY